MGIDVNKKEHKLNEYSKPPFLVSHIDLQIDLTKYPYVSHSTLTIKANPEVQFKVSDLVLDGTNMTLKSVQLNNQELNQEDYILDSDSLTIPKVPLDQEFTLSTTNELNDNFDLFGLYETEGTILVKAETEGLRRVLYCMDRPDILSTYKTTIIAHKKEYPVLLSNGDKIEAEDINDSVHSVTWLDTVPKPSYLFALVAGSQELRKDKYTTQTGKDIPIEFYVPAKALDQCEIAIGSLKKAMEWDEKTYHIPCDLNHYMVAGVDKYASGASEPTGLNLFNTQNLYASEQSKPDWSILRVMEVISHEFFHYLSGNRVTIENWFNLCLKEGLTDFRTFSFLEDLYGKDFIQLYKGKNLVPQAPRPESYTAVRSLYTAAAYEKSSDIFSMICLVLGKDGFNRALSLYFKEHDGKAVSLETILDSLTKSSGIDVHPFLSWFTESEIPEVVFSDTYNSETKKYTLTCTTHNRKSRPIPCVIGLLDNQGKEVQSDKTLMIDQDMMVFEFENINSRPTPSLFRSFSAPVRFKYDYSMEALILLLTHDNNLYNRSMGAKEIVNYLIAEYKNTKTIKFPQKLIETYRSLFQDKRLNEWFLAELLSIPTEEEIIQNSEQPDFDLILNSRKIIKETLAKELRQEFLELSNSLSNAPNDSLKKDCLYDLKAAGIRRLRSLCSSFLLITDKSEIEKQLNNQFDKALGSNMTDTLSALSMINEIRGSGYKSRLNDYLTYWENDSSAINYLYSLIASSHFEGVINQVISLKNSPDFDIMNPNRIYALFNPFIKNPYGFHASSGKGYMLLAEVILQLDEINPPVAARLMDAFINWDKYDEHRSMHMLATIQHLSKNVSSNDVSDKVYEALHKLETNGPFSLDSHGFFPKKNRIGKTDEKKPEDCLEIKGL